MASGRGIEVVKRFPHTPNQTVPVTYSWVKSGKRKGLAAPTSANPSSFMVAGVGFEPTTFGL